MRRSVLVPSLALASLLAASSPSAAQSPTFVNGLVIRGSQLDATGQPGANAGRLGFFSDLYYDAAREEWWALSDRGPGGGVLSYPTRLQQFSVKVDPITGAISKFSVERTITFTDPKGLLSGTDPAMNGLNPLVLNGHEGSLGRSFDPEGLAIDPRTGHFLVADEYGPSLYEFDRRGRLVHVFQTPANLVPKAGAAVNYVATRDVCPTPNVPFNPLCGGTAGRQDNRGYEGLAVSPDGTRLYAVLQDPLVNEPGPNNGRNGRNVRIVVFDNDRRSFSYGTSVAQYVYQLELQADVAARINAVKPGDATATDPRQGRNIGVSAIIALNDAEFLVLERDNRGLGVDDPTGARIVGSKRVYRIDITGATDVTTLTLPAGTLPAGVVPVTKSPVVIDLSANTMLPNGKQPEKWEGLTIGPRLKDGSYLILAGNDNDYSVTQNGGNVQFDVYVDFAGHFAKCVLDDPTRCEIDPPASDQAVDNPVPLPDGYMLIPGVLHAYKAPQGALGEYVRPYAERRDRDDHAGDDRD